MRRITIERLVAVMMIAQLAVNPVFAQKDGEPDSSIDNPAYTNDDSNISAPDSDDGDVTDSQSDEIVSVDGVLQNPFDVSISLGTQSPWSKKVPLYVSITPRIDATRTQITWETRYGLDFKYNYDDFFPMSKGVTQVFTAYVVPDEPGAYNLSVNVTDWGYGKNFTSTDNISITFGEDLITAPETQDYHQAVIIRYAILFFGALAFVVLLVFLGKFGLKWLKEWLKPPE